MKRKLVVVVGAGFAGLTAAKVLSEHFDSVVVLEKDERFGSAQPRSGAAQGAHLHVLLSRGQEILHSLFPGIENQFSLCPRIDWAADTEWETAGGAFPRYASTIRTLSFSRPFLENAIFTLVKKIPNISFRNAHVESIVLEEGRASSILCTDQSAYKPDLVVLAGGQHFPLQKMLTGIPILGQTIGKEISITYRSVLFQTDSLKQEGSKQYYYQFSPPHDTLGAVICPIEDGKSIATIVEYRTTSPLKMDIASFLELAQKIPGGKFAGIIKDGIAVSGVSAFQKSSMNLRLPHKIAKFPKNVILLGDTFCSLNPVFGQGMTLALEQALLLQACLEERDLSSHRFHRLSLKKVRLPYLLSKFGSGNEGGLAKNYLQAFLAHCRSNQKLHQKFLRVLHLEASYGALIDPSSLGKTLLKGISFHA